MAGAVTTQRLEEGVVRLIKLLLVLNYNNKQWGGIYQRIFLKKKYKSTTTHKAHHGYFAHTLGKYLQPERQEQR